MTEQVNTNDTAYAGDKSCIAKIKNITWWDKLNTFGPKTRHFAKVKKSWLIVKPEKYETAKSIFKNTKLTITSKCAVGSSSWYGGVQKRISYKIKKNRAN